MQEQVHVGARGWSHAPRGQDGHSQGMSRVRFVQGGVPLELMTHLENEALKFFMQSQCQKDKAGPPDPYGYGSKRIGTNGDLGWVEYLLLNTNPDVISPKTLQLFEQNPEVFR